MTAPKQVAACSEVPSRPLPGPVRRIRSEAIDKRQAASLPVGELSGVLSTWPRPLVADLPRRPLIWTVNYLAYWPPLWPPPSSTWTDRGLAPPTGPVSALWGDSSQWAERVVLGPS